MAIPGCHDRESVSSDLHSIESTVDSIHAAIISDIYPGNGMGSVTEHGESLLPVHKSVEQPASLTGTCGAS